MDIERIFSLVEKHGGEKGSLIAILEAIQHEFRFLPYEALKIVSEKTGRPFTEIYGVATFYKAFSLKPKGNHVISVCLGTACHVRGGNLIAEEFERQLGIEAGENTPDNEFSLDTVACLGACALGPIVMVDGRYFSNVDTLKVKKIIAEAKGGFASPDVRKDARIFPLELKCMHCNHSLMDPLHPIDGYPSIRVTVSFGDHHGRFYMSCLYGSFNVEMDAEIPLDTLMQMFCPHCHAEFVTSSNCLDCGAPLLPMIVKQGGIIQVCARRGCKTHRLDLNGANV
jgi:NADH-quinone oxidoreductase subunit E